MTSTLGEVTTAAKLRDIIVSVSRTQVEKMRPAERIGKVYSIDYTRSVAKIYFPGDDIDSLIEARFASDKIPTEQMISTFSTAGYNAVGNIVRIAGGPGTYYILDYVSGIPAIDPSARALVTTNTVTINANVTSVSTQVGTLQGELNVLDADLTDLNADMTLLQTVTLPALDAEIGQAQLDIDALENVTIPALNTRLTTAENQVSTLNTVTIPALNTSITNAQTQINTLNNTTIPNINTTLANNQTAINTLNAKFPITTTNISDGAITTPKMTANSINGDRITANTLGADKIIANSITAAQIGANTIGAKHLVLGDLTNYVADGDLSDPTSISWDMSGLTRVAPVGTAPAYLEWATLAAGNTHRYNLNYFEVAPGDEFYVRAEISTPAANTATINAALAIQTYDATGNTVTWPQTTTTIAPNTGWTLFEGTLTVPAGNSVRARFDPFINATNVAGQVIRMRSMMLRKKNIGKLIVDGAILTNHMTANTINGDRILANTLNASKIIAGTITTDRMTANTIDGSVITANTLNASKIVAGSITTATMTANTINGDRISTNTLNADRIVAGSITTATMTANTINGDRITVNTLHGDKIIANSIVATKLNVISGGGNLLRNSSFENTVNAWTDWTKYDNSAVATGTTTTGRRGGTAVRLSWSAAASIVGIYQAVTGGFKGNLTYVLSFYAKAGGGAVGGTMALAANAPLLTNVWQSNPPLTTDWQRYITTYIRAADTNDNLYLGIASNYGTAGVAKTLDLDDIQLEEGDLVTAYSPKVDEILPGTINAAMIQAGAINGQTITGVTIIGTSSITGALIRTAGSGSSRIQISNSPSDRLDWYNASDQNTSYIAGAGSALSFWNSSAQFYFTSPGGNSYLSASYLYLGGHLEHYGENRCDYNYGNYSTYGAVSDNQFRIYQANTNRTWWQYGSGWYSSEGSLTIGCEIYGNFIGWSDARDKTNTKTVEGALDMVRNLPVYDYDTRHGGALITKAKEDKNGNLLKKQDAKYKLVRKRGIMAQDLQKIAPHLVHDETNDPNTGFGMGVDLYGVMTTTLAGLQELDTLVQSLTAEVDRLKAELKKENNK